MLIAVYALFRGVFFMGFPDAKRASRTFLWGISATAIGMFFISQQYHCVINSNAYTYIWTGVFTTFTLIMMMRFFFVLKNENALNILLSLLLPLFFFFQTLLICYNATGQDHSTSCKVPILKKFIRSGKQKSYYVYLGSVSAGFPARNWHISFAKYQRINTGDSIDIRLRSGRLDLPWFFDADLSKY
jgi:FlaA1/EpsC-like NDP-sugar epimerase